MAMLYGELRQMANRVISGERKGQTLPATALVHEAFLRLSGAEVDWESRGHFLAVAASTMRRVMVDRAKARRRVKRGEGREHVELDGVELDGVLPLTADPPEMLLDLDDALSRLESFDARKSRVVEMMYFAGMTHEEVAEVLNISRATVQREARMAKAWLYGELHGAGQSQAPLE